MASSSGAVTCMSVLSAYAPLPRPIEAATPPNRGSLSFCLKLTSPQQSLLWGMLASLCSYLQVDWWR